MSFRVSGSQTYQLSLAQYSFTESSNIKIYLYFFLPCLSSLNPAPPRLGYHESTCSDVYPIEHDCLFSSTQSFYFAAALLYWANKTLCLYSVCEEHVRSWHVTIQCPHSSHVTLAICDVRQEQASHCRSLYSIAIVVCCGLQHLLGEFLIAHSSTIQEKHAIGCFFGGGVGFHQFRGDSPLSWLYRSVHLSWILIHYPVVYFLLVSVVSMRTLISQSRWMASWNYVSCRHFFERMGGVHCSFTQECNTIGESTFQECFFTSVFLAFSMWSYGISIVAKTLCLAIMDSGSGYQGREYIPQ